MAVDIAVLPGDGVGPEITDAALTVLDALGQRFDFEVAAHAHPVGWAAIESHGIPLPEGTTAACQAAEAVFLGAVGDPRGDERPPSERPEAGVLKLRSDLGCWGNLRPLVVSDALLGASALRPDRVRGTDLCVVRELGGGLYYGEPRGDSEGTAWNTLVYTEPEVRRIAGLAFDLAAARRGKVTSVDKANVLEASQLWRRVVEEVAAERTGVQCEHMFVDRAAMELVLEPTQFDVILTANLFGDVLSDEAGALAGSLGVLGSASIGGTTDLYEPVHGSAPDIAGRGIANPMGAFASVSLMMRHTLSLESAARALDAAVEATLLTGLRTADLRRAIQGPAREPVGTRAFTDAVVRHLST